MAERGGATLSHSTHSTIEGQRASSQSRRSREQVPNRLGIRLM